MTMSVGRHSALRTCSLHRKPIRKPIKVSLLRLWKGLLVAFPAHLGEPVVFCQNSPPVPMALKRAKSGQVGLFARSPRAEDADEPGGSEYLPVLHRSWKSLQGVQGPRGRAEKRFANPSGLLISGCGPKDMWCFPLLPLKPTPNTGDPQKGTAN